MYHPFIDNEERWRLKQVKTILNLKLVINHWRWVTYYSKHVCENLWEWFYINIRDWKKENNKFYYLI